MRSSCLPCPRQKYAHGKPKGKLKAVDTVGKRNTGRRVLVTTSEPVAGSQQHRGVLLGGNAQRWTLETETKERLDIPRDTIETARQDAGF